MIKRINPLDGGYINILELVPQDSGGVLYNNSRGKIYDEGISSTNYNVYYPHIDILKIRVFETLDNTNKLTPGKIQLVLTGCGKLKQLDKFEISEKDIREFKKTRYL